MTTFDEHVNEALALIAGDRRTSAPPRPAQLARASRRSRHLALVPHPDAERKTVR